MVILTGLDVTQAAAALDIRPATVRLSIRKGLLQANKLGSRWQVYLPGRGCSLCEGAGTRTILVKCATCEGYHCGFHSLSICKAGEHGQSRAVTGA